MDYDGSNIRTVTANQGINKFPDWSGDNSKLAFVTILPGSARWQFWIQSLQGGRSVVPNAHFIRVVAGFLSRWPADRLLPPAAAGIPMRTSTWETPTDPTISTFPIIPPSTLRRPGAPRPGRSPSFRTGTGRAPALAHGCRRGRPPATGVGRRSLRTVPVGRRTGDTSSIPGRPRNVGSTTFTSWRWPADRASN